jgi:cell division protein FtsN
LKERTFYTINLDTTRIIVISFILLLLVSYSFTLGYTIGKKKALKDQNNIEVSSNTPTETITKKNEKIEAQNSEKSEELKEENDPIKSEIFDLKPVDEEDNSNIAKKEEPQNTNEKSTKTNRKKRFTEKQEIDSTFYTIQLGAFSTKAKAKKYKIYLLESYKIFTKIPLYIAKVGENYAVRMGRATQKEDLEAILDKLDPDVKKSAIITKN